LALPTASGPVFKFCALGSVFGDSERVGTRFHVLRARTHFRCFRVRRVLFSRFALPDAFSAFPSGSGPVFKFCPPGCVFGVTECVGSVFTFGAPGHVFGVTECVGSRFQVSRSGTRFPRFRVRRFPFSRFALLELFSVLMRALGPVFAFSHFVLPDAILPLPSASDPVFTFCALGRVFGITECVWSRFHVLRFRSLFGRDRVRWVPFSSFALRDAFSAFPSGSGRVFKFCPAGRVFGDSERVGTRFQVLLSRTRFRCDRAR